MASVTQPVEVKPRKMTFAFEEVEERYWYNGNPIISAYFTALSATFPPGEKEFIESVRAYQQDITDPELEKAVRGFIGQEAHHSQQHHRLNEHFDRLGLHATRLEKHLATHIQKQRQRFSKEVLLAATVGMEHVTAILADHVLRHPELLTPAPKPLAELLRWHAIEEVEHKSVAFEVYQRAVGDQKLLHRVMRLQTVEFLMRTACYTWAILFWNRTVPSLKQMAEAHRFFWGKNGFYRKNFGPWRKYFQRGFHPWQENNQDLIEAWKETLSA